MPYSSSLSDQEWEILEPLLLEFLPPKKRTRPPEWTKREILDGILYQLKNGYNWEDLPFILAPLLNGVLALQVVARWVIERSNAWMERFKSLVKNFERTLSHATTKINLCFVRLMLKRLAALS